MCGACGSMQQSLNIFSLIVISHRLSRGVPNLLRANGFSHQDSAGGTLDPGTDLIRALSGALQLFPEHGRDDRLAYSIHRS